MMQSRMAWIGAAAACCVLVGAVPLEAQRSDSTMGSVVRVVAVRTGQVGARPRSSSGAGLLIRRRGQLQRVDVLDAADDTLGSDWIGVQNTPMEIRINNVGQRSSLVMRFDDLRTTFTSLLQIRFDSVRADAEDLGAGPKVLGYETRRVQIHRSFRMQTRRR